MDRIIEDADNAFNLSNFSVAFTIYDSLCKRSQEHDDNGYVMFRAGFCLFYGLGVPEDQVKAFELFSRAVPLLANSTSPPSLYALGEMNFNGFGVPVNKKLAMECYSKSANKGFAPAQNNLGVLFQQGEGSYPDPKEAFKWFQAAASQGDAAALYSVGVFYRDGKAPVSQSAAEAVNCFTKSANLGLSESQFELGKIYWFGLADVIPNHDLGKKYLQLAAAQNHPAAISTLSTLSTLSS